MQLYFLGSYFKARVGPFGIGGLASTEAYEVLGFRMWRCCDKCLGIGYCHLACLAYCQLQRRKLSTSNLDAVFQKHIAHSKVVQHALLQLALECKYAVGPIAECKLQRLVHLLHSIALGCRRTVGKHNTIATEVVVVRNIAKVAAISPVFSFRRVERGVYVGLSLSA